MTTLPQPTDKLKVVLLAGGHGTRAKPFTDYFPKAMFPLDGRPIIDHIVRFLAHFASISEIIIVCDFDRFGKQIINYFQGKVPILGKSIKFVEDRKKGTGGSLLAVEKYVERDECFLVWFADNLSALKIDNMIQKYNFISSKNEETIIGMIAVRKKRYEETGRVVLENHHGNSANSDTCIKIKKFMEKRTLTLEQPEALGIYIFSNGIFKYLHKRSNEGYISFNLSYDILEKISDNANLFSYDIGDVEWLDAQSLAYLDRNKDVIEKILFQMYSISGH